MYLRYDFPGVVPRLNHVCYAVLSECFSFVLCLSYVSLEMSCVRFYPNVLRSFCACHTFLSECLAFDHACCLPPVRQTERLAGCSVPIPPWVGIAIRAFSDVAWLSDLVGSFRACAFLYGDPDGERRDGGTRRTESAARQSAFLRDHIGFAAFSAGSPLGAARPQTCAKEPLALWTLFIWVVMWARFTRRRALGYNEDLTESNLCSGKSCGRTIAPIRLVI